MSKTNKPNSLRKFIRKEKARIRREVLDVKEQKNLILEFYSRIVRKPENKEQKIESKERKAESKKKITKKKKKT